MTPEGTKTAIQLIERLGLPVVLVAVFAYVLWNRTNTIIATEHEYATKQAEQCDEQLTVLKEIRELIRLGRPGRIDDK